MATHRSQWVFGQRQDRSWHYSLTPAPSTKAQPWQWEGEIGAKIIATASRTSDSRRRCADACLKAYAETSVSHHEGEPGRNYLMSEWPNEELECMSRSIRREPANTYIVSHLGTTLVGSDSQMNYRTIGDSRRRKQEEARVSGRDDANSESAETVDGCRPVVTARYQFAASSETSGIPYMDYTFTGAPPHRKGRRLRWAIDRLSVSRALETLALGI
ncbi:hypothetical protein V8E55_001210 [Tylopilus felleus]